MRTFTLTIRRVRDTYRVIAETSEPGLAASTRVDELFVLDQASLPIIRTLGASFDAALAYGTTLGNAVFVGKVGESMQRAQSRADQAGEVLHVLLAIEDSDLIPLRWERLCGRLDGGWQFLRLQQRTPFSFYLPSENDKRYRSAGSSEAGVRQSRQRGRGNSLVYDERFGLLFRPMEVTVGKAAQPPQYTSPTEDHHETTPFSTGC